MVSKKQGKVTRASIARKIMTAIGVNGVESTKITEDILHSVITAICTEKKLKISGFGSFIVKRRASRKGRNLQTGDIIHIPEKNDVVFKPSLMLKNKILKADKKNKQHAIVNE